MKIGTIDAYGVIYKITNKINNKSYIGQTTNADGIRGRYRISKKMDLVEGIYRFHGNLRKYDKGGFNKHLFGSIEKYGYKNFEVSQFLDIAFSKEELDIKERRYILYYKTTDSNYGYNIQEGGVGGKNNDEIIEKVITSQIKNGRTRFIRQLEFPSLRILNTYPSIGSATKSLNLSRSAIRNVLNPRCISSITAGGFCWEYIEAPNLKYKDIKNIEQVKKDTLSQVIHLYTSGYTNEKIIKITGVSSYAITSIINSRDIKTKHDIRKHEAELKRKEILEYYIKGKCQKEIMDATGYTKSIVEKALGKYREGKININGVYINNIMKECG